MSRKISAAMLKESTECFTIYSKNGIMAIEDLGMALRSLGLNPTNKEIDDLEKELGHPSGINYEIFKVSNFFINSGTADLKFYKLNYINPLTTAGLYIVILSVVPN